MKNDLYWTYNLPLQVFPIRADKDDETSTVTGHNILNYSPRKSRCEETDLSELLENQTAEEYFEAAAAHLEHLASMFRKYAKGEIDHVYYADDGMDKSKLP